MTTAVPTSDGTANASAVSATQLQKEVRIACETQQRLLPVSPLEVAGLRLELAVHAATELSGDFVDYLALDDGAVLFCLADVAGHGVHAALFTPLLKHLFRSTPEHAGNLDLDAWMGRFGRALASTQTRVHVALCVGVVAADRAHVRIAGAAQFPPPLLCAGGQCETIDLIGKPLGLFPDAHYAQRVLSFPAGARLLVFSDGILDVLEGDDEVRLNTLCERALQAPANCAALLHEIGVDLSVARKDDIACLVIERTSSP